MILVYEMQYTGSKVTSDINLIPFMDEYYNTYETIYNECFYEMRKALDIKPYNFYHSIEQLENKKSNIFLLLQEGQLVGSVACIDNEIDDLIVNKKCQGKGYGKKLLLFAINHMQKSGVTPIKLHVAKWNEKAVSLYEKYGFQCVHIERIK